MITSIAFVVYPVKDMARARTFYENTLGLKLETNFGDQWLEYDVAGGTFALTTMDEKHQPGVGGALVAFEVAELDSFIAGLKAQDVRFLADVAESPVCRFAIIADPDGNELFIHKRK